LGKKNHHHGVLYIQSEEYLRGSGERLLWKERQRRGIRPPLELSRRMRGRNSSQPKDIIFFMYNVILRETVVSKGGRRLVKCT